MVQKKASLGKWEHKQNMKIYQAHWRMKTVTSLQLCIRLSKCSQTIIKRHLDNKAQLTWKVIFRCRQISSQRIQESIILSYCLKKRFRNNLPKNQNYKKHIGCNHAWTILQGYYTTRVKSLIKLTKIYFPITKIGFCIALKTNPQSKTLLAQVNSKKTSNID